MPEQPPDCTLPRVTRPLPLMVRAGVVTPESPLRPLHPASEAQAVRMHPPVQAAAQAPSISAPPTPATPPKLRRAWFGLAPSVAQQLLSDQGRELQARVEAARAELKAEQARQEELAGEVRRTRARLEALQADLEMLRAALAREQEQAPVTAEVVSRRLATLRQAHETRLQNLRFEAIRLEAELERRESQVLAIAAELYRIASGHGQLPAGLAVRMPAPQSGAPASPAEPKAPEAEAEPEPALPDET